MSKKVINIRDYQGTWSDIWGCEGQFANVLIEHNIKNDHLKIHAVDVDNNVIDVEIDSDSAFNLLETLGEVLGHKRQ